jgi:hypothetical protein
VLGDLILESLTLESLTPSVHAPLKVVPLAIKFVCSSQNIKPHHAMPPFVEDEYQLEVHTFEIL